jgi:hypothetical protein
LERLEEIVAEFVTETRRGFDQAAEQFREVAKCMRETDERIRENDGRCSERARQSDERIDKIVVAIGEFIRRNPTPPTSQ